MDNKRTFNVSFKTARNLTEADLTSKDDNDEIIDENVIDEDVRKEKELVKNICNTFGEKPTVLVKNVSKSFKIKELSHVAIKNVSLAIDSGIFGLLGPNGAGKTTLIKMITREEREDSGRIFIDGEMLRYEWTNNLTSTCPQINPVWPNITVMEHLRYYAAVRGVSSDQIIPYCNYLISSLNLDENKNKEFKKLSGGNKRKVLLVFNRFKLSLITFLLSN